MFTIVEIKLINVIAFVKQLKTVTLVDLLNAMCIIYISLLYMIIRCISRVMCH